MQLTGSEDLRVIKTIRAIKSTFETLLCEQEYETITVKALCDRAAINKKTFYHYYPSLDDLLAEMQIEISSAYIERVKGFRLPEQIREINREFFRYSASQGPAYEKITCASGSYSYIRQQMIDRVTARTWEQSAAYRKLDDFTRGAFLEHINSINVMLYRRWVASGKREPIEKLIALANTLTTEGINGLFVRKDKM